MSRKHYTIISRREISNNSRFVIALRVRSYSSDFVFFSGRRIPRTNTYAVRVYDCLGHVLDMFQMVRTHGTWHISALAAIRECGWNVVVRFYRELTEYMANDLLLALRIEDTRSYISAKEAVIAIARQLELSNNALLGLNRAVVHAAVGGECR